MLSVLYGLGVRVVNRPTPQGLAGRLRTHAEWPGWPAAQDFVRRTTGKTTSGSSHVRIARRHCPTRIVFDGRVYGVALPSDVLAPLSPWPDWRRARLLGVDLSRRSEGDWWFTAASIVPDLRVGGEPLLDALTPALGGPAT